MFDIEREDERYYIYDDDMIVDYYDEYGHGLADKSIKLWEKKGPKAVIPFEIKEEVSSDKLDEIKRALEQFNNTCIR